ncbi:DoxX-like family protein [Tunturiibacter lichenicola]|uniref:DoxX-like family protein n=1 Tax=Tunturiibacter lichenicola TaxID=2051959 RepID=UPI0021B39099|nr:DoxX-like family protein [Edaphobacter lichenicola]
MNIGPRSQPGIYVEIHIADSVDRIWQLTQQPDLHQRWDLRFTRITYLPRATPADPQRFLYETRIGFGLAIKGTGESVGQRSNNGDTTSSLKFASDDPKSLIRQGSGYWRYIPTDHGTRFFTWYDYQVRFGAVGRIIDRIVFRPLIGWATAWSFDRLRLWIETGQSPETSRDLSAIHAIARITLAFVWIWHGLVPKLLFHHIDERTMLSQSGLSPDWLPWIGAAEILFGILVLCTWSKRAIFVISGALMILATAAVSMKSPMYLTAAFNPITLNLTVLAICIVGWLASRTLPSAKRCLRIDPRTQQ